MYRLILFRLSESYFRRRWLYLLPLVLMLVFGAGYLILTKPTYISQGILYIQTDTYLSQLTDLNKNPTASWWTTPAQNTTNELNELIQTDAFIRAVIQETNLEKGMNQGPIVVWRTIDTVRKEVWVVAQGNNQVLVGAKSDDPLVAIQLANGVINNYIRWHTNARRNDSEVALNFFTNLISQYRDELAKAHTAMADYIRAHPVPLRGDRPELEQMDIQRLQSDITLAETRYSNAMEKEENARLSLVQIESEVKQTFTVIDAPHIPPNSTNSKKDIAIKIGIFAAIGLLLSGGLILGTALADHSFLAPADIQEQLSLPVLAVIPDTSPSRKERRAAARRAKAEAQEKKRMEKQLKKKGKGQKTEGQEAAGPVEAAATPQDETVLPESNPSMPETEIIPMGEPDPVLDKASA